MGIFDLETTIQSNDVPIAKESSGVDNRGKIESPQKSKYTPEEVVLRKLKLQWIRNTRKARDEYKKSADEYKKLASDHEKNANTDELTRLPNRRFIQEVLQNNFREAVETGNPLSVLMIDVDHFKKFNDTYGHDVGDLVLKAVADALRKSLRGKTDLMIPIVNEEDQDAEKLMVTRSEIARYGGEEILVVLPGIRESVAVNIGERLRKAVESLTVYPSKNSHDPVKITVSIGVANTKSDPVDTAEELLKAADGNLYVAKANGRNRIVSREIAEKLIEKEETK